ncbi:MAG: tetratricopeptide repeat protein [Candidatus Loosdrechtia sp.]|uniref:tetratricopeptide repeat protein n=1 Tax=Candidatus Loosdrechtia sp. TaxID=3101272 RepID=UPI003A6A7846|nr:MAG: tetratricopeptide repeat protein [Candidatus Jettenia sp. AMX2]
MVPLKEFTDTSGNTEKTSGEGSPSFLSKSIFKKRSRQFLIISGIVFTILALAFFSFWILRERAYYQELLTGKDELIRTLKLTRDKQKAMYENAVDSYETKLATEYIPRSVYDDRIDRYEQELDNYRDHYVPRDYHVNQIEQLKQQLEEVTGKKTTSQEEAEEKLAALMQRIGILEDKNLAAETTLNKLRALLKEEKERWEDALMQERRKAFIPSLILPETRKNNLDRQVLERLTALKEKLKSLESVSVTLQPSTYFEMGLVSFYNGHYAEAIELWERSRSLDRNNLRTYICLALVYHETDMSEKAIRILQRAAETFPPYATLHLTSARIYEQKGDLDSAVHEYLRVLEINPQLADIHHTLGVLYDKKGLKEEAMKSFARYEKLNKEIRQE